MAALIFAEAGASQRQHVLRGDRTTVGRHGENDLVLGDTLVSRRHCIIEARAIGHVLVDLGSTYGTYLNEERVEGTKPLKYGDRIRVGKTTMKFSEEVENTRTAGTSDFVDHASTDGGTRKQPTLVRELTEARILAEALAAYVRKQPDGATLSGESQRLLDRLTGFETSLAEMEQNRVLTQTLSAVGQIINQVTDLDLVLKITMDHALRALGAERGYILLRAEDGVLSVRMTRNMGDIRGFSQSIAESVIENGKSILTTDAQVDPRFSRAQSVMINAIRAVMCVPLRGRSVQAVGAIFVDGVPGNPMFSDRGMQFLNSFAGQAATAIENAALAQKSALEQRRRERLSRYFSGPVIEDILAAGESGESERLGGESRMVTLAFTDIRGFTSLLERIKPQDAVEMLNDYFTDIVDEVIAEEGTLDKFMGDGLMAFWNAPNDQADHALRAVKAALKMQERVSLLVARWTREGRSFMTDNPDLSTGIGINTGEAIVGNIGSPKRMEYTAIGDAVNLAARLQGVAKGGEVLISESTLALVKDRVRWTRLEPVSIKGKANPVPLFRVDSLT